MIHIVKLNKGISFGSMLSRIEQVKFLEGSIQEI